MIWIILFCVIFLCGAFWMMRTAFQSLSFEVLERNNRIFLDLARSTFEKAQESTQANLERRNQSVEAVLVPLRETIQSLDGHQRELEKKRASSYAALQQQIEGMMQAQRELRQETTELSSALRSPSVRGSWGQVHLRRVVELAGLLNHCDFSEQSSHENEGRILRPDLIVHLPGNREIVIDAKTPLNAFLEAEASSDETTKKKCLENHLLSLKKHMRELAQKDYWKRFDLSPEFVVLFLPAESFFSTALQADPTLIESGAEQNILVATPTTLIAILRAVAHSWKQETLSKNAEQIARLGQELYERLMLLSEYWSKVGKSLTSAVDAYNQAIGSLESRVFVTARKLKDQGAAPLLNKTIEPLEPIDKTTRTHNSLPI